jgi:hypothetical protein
MFTTEINANPPPPEANKIGTNYISCSSEFLLRHSNVSAVLNRLKVVYMEKSLSRKRTGFRAFIRTHCNMAYMMKNMVIKIKLSLYSIM